MLFSCCRFCLFFMIGSPFRHFHLFTNVFTASPLSYVTRTKYTPEAGVIFGRTYFFLEWPHYNRKKCIFAADLRKVKKFN